MLSRAAAPMLAHETLAVPPHLGASCYILLAMPRMHPPHAAVIKFATTFLPQPIALQGKGRRVQSIRAALQGRAKRGREDEHLVTLAEEQGYGRPQGLAAARARR